MEMLSVPRGQTPCPFHNPVPAPHMSTLKSVLPCPSFPKAMKPSRGALLAATLLVVLQTSAFATTFFVATTGSDSNPGTQTSPFKSLTKAQSVAVSGDTVSIRGGTYSSFTIAGSDSNYNFVHNITKSGITYAAFTGETPVFNFSSIA